MIRHFVLSDPVFCTLCSDPQVDRDKAFPVETFISICVATLHGRTDLLITRVDGWP